ncbi:hypothetical protein EP232_00525 [bacterium]|nr:MAG: hypothetical protein EP232_00525 [bacterium]
MKEFRIDVNNLSQKEYLRLFGKLILYADMGAVCACLAWMFYWLDHIPSHVFHTHLITPFLFLAAMMSGLYAIWIMIRTGKWVGTRSDRFWIFLEASYATGASILGIIAYFIHPPH